MTTNEPTPYTKEEALKEAEECRHLREQFHTSRHPVAQSWIKKLARKEVTWRIYAEMVERDERLRELLAKLPAGPQSDKHGKWLTKTAAEWVEFFSWFNAKDLTPARCSDLQRHLRIAAAVEPFAVPAAKETA